MRIVPIDPKHPDPRYLREAVAVLKRGGLVVYPTETAYALGCDAANLAARRRLCKVKGREREKLLPLIVSSFDMAQKVVSFNAEARRLARKYWPGPLTLRLPDKRQTQHESTTALRVSSNLVARALAARLGRPIVSTSANMSGEPTKYDIPGVIHDIGFKPDFVLDARTLRPTPPSTIVGFDHGLPIILRAGPIDF
jgi:L-threonylcarbamoyladenylate synthase